MKYLIPLLFFALASFVCAQNPAIVYKIKGNNALVEPLVVPSGITFRISSGATIVADAGSTVTGFGSGSPTWGMITGTISNQTDLQAALNTKQDVITVLAAAFGGTGNSSYAQGDLIYASATNILSKLAKSTGATRYISNGGTSNNPLWAQINLSNGVTGTLPAANGGTGINTAWSNGQTIIGNTAGGITRATITPGNGVGVTNGDGSITLAAITQMSVTVNSSGLKLVNDTASPGNSMVYGTDSGGLKGWKNDPSGGASEPTGTLKDYLGVTAPSGYVIGDGGTIGDASSGATNRANDDTSALFALLWNNYDDSVLPVSGGRGANATTDFAAHKTITLPDFHGKIAVPQKDASVFAMMGATPGEEIHTMLDMELVSHTHNFSVNVDTGSPVTVAAGMDFSVLQFATAPTYTTAADGGGTPFNVVQPSFVVGCKIIKL